MVKNRILHIISNLEEGGAEAILYRVVSLSSGEYEQVVVSLKTSEKYKKRLNENNVRVIDLKIRGFFSLLWAILRLFVLIHKVRPHVVQTWLYHADFIGGMVSYLCGVKRIIWTVHNTSLRYHGSKISTIVIRYFLSVLSRYIPNKIIYCAESSRREHVDIGYDDNRSCVIRNGYSEKEFFISTSERQETRKALCLSDEIFVIGCIARNDPQKDLPNLFSSLKQLVQSRQNWICVLIGSGVTDLIDDIPIEIRKNVILLPPTNNIRKIINSFDIHVLPSQYGEACPNVVAECMLCGVPCVSTDVGDAKILQGELGFVVLPSRPDMLEAKIVNLIRMRETRPADWRRLGINCRNRIIREFDFNNMLRGYHKEWKI